MILSEMKTVRGRWLKVDRDTFSNIVNLIKKENVNSESISNFLGVGFEKVRSILDYLIMFGIIEKRNKRDKFIYLNNYYMKIHDVLLPNELSELYYYNFVQNYQLMNWIILDFCSHRLENGINYFTIDEVKKLVNDFIIKYKSNTDEDSILRYIKQDIELLLNKNSPLYGLNLFFMSSDGILHIRNNSAFSQKIITIIFYIAWKTFYNDITNMKIEDIIKNNRFPFRVFFINPDTALKYFVDMEARKIIKMVDTADIRHITLNKSIEFNDLLNILERED